MEQEEMFAPPPVTGYRELSVREVALMNEIKQKANEVGVIVDRLAVMGSVDTRWVSIAKTDLQKGFMALVRAVAQPTSF